MKKNLTLLTAAMLGASALFCGDVVADERTGREIKEVLGDLTQELNVAQKKVAKIEEERISKKNATVKNLLPQRAKALKELEKLSEKYHYEKDPAKKKELSKQVESKIMKTSELGTDFVESIKNDLVYQDKQLQVIQETLSGVILKMEKLAKLTKGKGDAASSATAKLKARKSLHNLAKMVEVFATKHRNNHQWGSIRQTIMLQDKLLRHNSLAHNKIQYMLKNQKKLYEQVLAQVVVARRGLSAEKQTLVQITIGDLAKFILRKTANLHLGNESVLKIGKLAFKGSFERHKKLETYMKQDSDIGLSMTGDAEEIKSASTDAPAGYDEYLESTIN